MRCRDQNAGTMTVAVHKRIGGAGPLQHERAGFKMHRDCHRCSPTTPDEALATSIHLSK
jgi:hypothetical protein